MYAFFALLIILALVLFWSRIEVLIRRQRNRQLQKQIDQILGNPSGFRWVNRVEADELTALEGKMRENDYWIERRRIGV